MLPSALSTTNWYERRGSRAKWIGSGSPITMLRETVNTEVSMRNKEKQGKQEQCDQVIKYTHFKLVRLKRA